MTTKVSMLLGPFGFEALGFGYDGVTRRVSTPWATQQVAQTIDQQQWTGPTSDEVTIKGVLFNEEFGGQASLDGIIAASLSGTPLMLVTGDEAEGVIQGTFTIQSVDEDRSFHTLHGAARRNGYSIALKRYGQGAGETASLLAPILSLFG